MSEITRTTSAQEFQDTVVEGSRQQPVLVEMGSTTWCPDCTVLEDTGVLDEIAQDGRVRVVQHETPRETVTEAWAMDHPTQAAQHNVPVPATPSPEAQLLSGLEVENYPSVFLFDGGRKRQYYSEDPSADGRHRRDRAVDSDLVQRDPQTRERSPKPQGIAALKASVNWFTSRRR